MVNSNVIPDSPDICDTNIQPNQNAKEYDDERVVLANLIANLKLDIDKNKKIQKQLKKANASLTQELKECKSTLKETNRTLGESNSTQDSCLIAPQNKQTDLETESPTQAWLWHRILSHLNFDYINLLLKKAMVIGLPELKYVKDQLCSSCELSKAKRTSFKTKIVPSSKGRLNLFHIDLCGHMRVESINGKKYILMIQRNLQAQVIIIRTDKGIKFLNKTLHAYFKEKRIEHQISTPRTPEHNGIVKRQNGTLVEAARMMRLAFKLPLFFWVEAITTACYTQNRSIIITTHEKTAYHIINDRKPTIRPIHIFSCTCYFTKDGENHDKMKEKGYTCIQQIQQLRHNKSWIFYSVLCTMIFLLQNQTPTTTVHAEENNNNQAADAHFKLYEFVNPFCTPEEVYVAQPDGFINPDHPEKVYRLKKALYGLKQALRARTLDSSILKRYLYQSGQDCTAMSSAEAEYATLSASCAQVMWMRTRLKDYGFNYNRIPLYYDSQSATSISCNPVQHSRTKHIHTRYHYIKEQVERCIIELYFVRTEYQLADMFTKALPEDRFQYIVRGTGIRCLTPAELKVLANESA
uniref:Integrase catalytic domain-containing protein n=1 Tax=Tanacetum cinerariifolium TaxID=118510 RepID=A0A6L2JFL5_TANCI|nr:hypothetical protein [Tanacetum cinerariifolium]